VHILLGPTIEIVGMPLAKKLTQRRHMRLVSLMILWFNIWIWFSDEKKRWKIAEGSDGV